MKHLTIRNTLMAVLAALAVALAAPAPAQSTNKPAKKETTGATNKSLPLRGTITATDSTAMTLTIGERTFAVTPTTKFTKGGKPATFADAKTGEEVGGSYKKEGAKLELISLRIGPKPEQATGTKKKSQPQ